MGQDSSSLSGRQPELALQPGTYRIVSQVAGTAIQVSEHDHNKVVAWERHDRICQKWFVQSSGDGYKFKNCQHGNYLAVSSTDMHALVYASRFPTTWVLLKTNDGYLVQYADNNRVLDLHYGWKNNGNEIHIWPAGDNANKMWKFEHLSDETGEELPASFKMQGDRLTQDLYAQTQDLAQKGQRIASLERELVDQRREVEEKAQAIAKMAADLAQKDRDLVEKDTIIQRLHTEAKGEKGETSSVNREDEENSRLRKQQVQLQSDLSRQQAETASLQAKMDRVEYLMARMSKSYEQA
ncbi:hypothetical protein FRC12_015432 [Ceratobasidium sp. 428]|nr:hypothetical protein FRC12_015432 [Ceratobasidium sp. 428]